MNCLEMMVVLKMCHNCLFFFFLIKVKFMNCLEIKVFVKFHLFFFKSRSNS